MALKECRECKKSVSSEAAACPHCGVKNPTKKSSSKLAWVGLGLFALVCTASIGSRTKDAAQASKEQAVVAAQVAAVQVSVQSPEPSVEPAKPALALNARERKSLELLLEEDVTAFANGGDTMVERHPELVGGAKAVTADALQKAYEANEVSADQAYRDKRLVVRGTVDSINRSIGDSHYVSLRGGSNMFIKPNAKMADGNVNYLASLAKGQKVGLVCEGGGMLMGSAWLNDCVPVSAWVPAVVSELTNQMITKASTGDELGVHLVSMALVVDALAPPEHACWTKNTCTKELAKAKTMPELRTQIANRLGVEESELRGFK